LRWNPVPGGRLSEGESPGTKKKSAACPAAGSPQGSRRHKEKSRPLALEIVTSSSSAERGAKALPVG